MPQVIRIYIAKHDFKKPNYTAANRKTAEILDESICPVSGFVDSSILFLPEKYKSRNEEFENADLIMIEEFKGLNPYKDDQTNRHHCHNESNKIISFRQFTVSKSYRIFKLNLINHSTCEITRTSTDSIANFGIPKRQNHKLFDLLPNNALIYKTNYKFDIAGSLPSQRTFCEEIYIFEHLGEITDINYLPDNQMAVQVPLPITTSKVIDERKNLW